MFLLGPLFRHTQLAVLSGSGLRVQGLGGCTPSCGVCRKVGFPLWESNVSKKITVILEFG